MVNHTNRVGKMVVVLLFMFCLMLTGVQAWATDYYVDSNWWHEGVGTEADPFKTFSPLNAISDSGGFAPGTFIYLKRGSVWNEELRIRQSASGWPDNWSWITPYGTGARPKIDRNGHWNDKCIVFYDLDCWAISGLELCDAGAGLVVWYTTGNHYGIDISDLYVHHIRGVMWNENSSTPPMVRNSAGIVFGGNLPNPGTITHVLHSIHVSWIEGTHNALSLELAPVGGNVGIPGEDVWQSALLHDLYFHQDDAGITYQGEELDCQSSEWFEPGIDYPIDYGCCPASLHVQLARNITIRNAYIDWAGSCKTQSGTAGMAFAITKDCSFTNGMITEVPETYSCDETGIDYETTTDSCNIRNTYFWANTNNAIEFIGDPNQYNNEISGNTFVNNGTYIIPVDRDIRCGQWGQTVFCERPQGALCQFGAPTNTGSVLNNLFVEPSGFNSELSDSGAWNGYTHSNNRVIVSESDVYHSGAQYSTTQGPRWKNQYWDVDQWKDMETAPATAATEKLVTFVNAPNGMHVNGWWDNNDQNRINFGTDLWASWEGYGLSSGAIAYQLTGYQDRDETRTITLAANKKLKQVDIGRIGGVLGTITFSSPANPGQDRTIDLTTCPRNNYALNWTNPSPTVNITITTSNCCVGAVGFDNFVLEDPAGAPDWKGSWSISGDPASYIGRFTMMPANRDVARAWVAPVAGKISIRGRAVMVWAWGGDGVQVRITKNVTTTLLNWQTVSTSDAVGVETNLDDISVAAGDIIRFEMNRNADSFTDETSWVPSVAYMYDRAYDWQFSVDSNPANTRVGWEGFQNPTNLSAYTAAGQLNLTMNGGTAYINSRDPLGLDGNVFRRVEIKITNNTSGKRTVNVWFITQNDQTWNSTKSKSFTINAGATVTTTLDMSTIAAWTASPVKQIRLRFPTTTAGWNFTVDWVRIKK